jgi:hypothetical protein
MMWEVVVSRDIPIEGHVEEDTDPDSQPMRKSASPALDFAI